MLSPEAALLVANGFCTLRLAQGSQFSQPLFAAALPIFPHPSSKGETHEIICTVSPNNKPFPQHPTWLWVREETTVLRLREAGQGNRHQATQHRVGAL